ncbi:MAG: DUF2080 family transposase-associated protein [archaeon]
MPRKIKVEKDKLSFVEKFDVFFEKKITRFGTGAKIDAPKEFLDRDVIVFIKKSENVGGELL